MTKQEPILHILSIPHSLLQSCRENSFTTVFLVCVCHSRVPFEWQVMPMASILLSFLCLSSMLLFSTTCFLIHSPFCFYAFTPPRFVCFVLLTADQFHGGYVEVWPTISNVLELYIEFHYFSCSSCLSCTYGPIFNLCKC